MRSRCLLTGLLRWKGKSAGEYHVGVLVCYQRGCADAGLPSAGFLPPPGQDEEERPACVHGCGQQDREGDSSHQHVGRGEVRRAVPGAARCRALGCWDERGPAPGTWSRLEYLAPGWGLIFYANSCLQRMWCCGSWYCRVRRRAAELPTVLKAGSNRASGRAGWLRLARHGSARRGLCHPRAPQMHPGRAGQRVGSLTVTSRSLGT